MVMMLLIMMIRIIITNKSDICLHCVGINVCVCVCVREREIYREKEKERERERDGVCVFKRG